MRPLAILLASIILVSAVSASNVEIEVSEDLRGSFVTYSAVASQLINATGEFYNSGSAPYSVRLRMDAGDYSVWTAERAMNPGDRQLFSLYLPKGAENVRVRAYFGNEILATNWTQVSAGSAETMDAFNISNVKTSKNSITFTLASSVDTAVAIASTKYPKGWIFEQTLVGALKGESVRVEMNYTASVWSPKNVEVSIFSLDGRYLSKKTVALTDEKRGVNFIKIILTPLLALFG